MIMDAFKAANALTNYQTDNFRLLRQALATLLDENKKGLWFWELKQEKNNE